MKFLIASVACVLSATSALAEVKATVGDISDKRTTGQFFKGLEIELKLTGPEIAEAKAMRTVVETATDDSGTEIPKQESGFSGDKDFQEIQRNNFGDDADAKDLAVIKVEFSNPLRSAKSIKSLKGSISLLIPKHDPSSVITASVAKDIDKPLVNVALKAGGVEFKLVKASDENDLAYEIKDPKGKVAAVEFVGADGTELKRAGSMSSGAFGGKSVTISFSEKPPADALAKIYLITEKSLVTVPLNLENIPLP